MRQLIPVLFLSIVFSLPIVARGQSCGVQPGSFQYSERFYQAEAKLYKSTSATTAGVDVVYDDLPIKGSFSSKNSVSNYESLTIEQAKSYIQQEHTDRGAQIIAECGYRLCTLANSPGSMNPIAISVLQEVCTQALTPRDVSVGLLSASPRVSTTIFDKDEKTQTHDINVSNTSPGAMPVKAVVDQGTAGGTYVTVSGQSTFTIPPKSSRTVKIVVKRPGTGKTITGSVKFVATADSTVSATTDFAIYADPSLLLPSANIPSGTLFPNASLYLDIDNPTSPFTASQPGPYSVPVHQGPYMCNPGGFNDCAKAEYNASATSSGSSLDQTAAAFRLDSTIGGTCGSGNNGGDGGINPRWQTVLSLPGLADRHKWHVKLSSDIRHYKGSCTVSLASKIDAVKIDGVSSLDYADLPPGSYILETNCTGPVTAVGCHGHANGINEHFEAVHYFVNLDASRQSVAHVAAAGPAPGTPAPGNSGISVSEIAVQSAELPDSFKNIKMQDGQNQQPVSKPPQ